GVAAREVGRALGERCDAGAGPDGLIVERDAVALLRRAPLLVDGRGERRTGAVHRAGGRAAAVTGRGAVVVAAPTRGHTERKRAKRCRDQQPHLRILRHAAKVAGHDAEPVTPLCRSCEKDVKAQDRGDTRSPRACGWSDTPAGPSRPSRAACSTT